MEDIRGWAQQGGKIGRQRYKRMRIVRCTNCLQKYELAVTSSWRLRKRVSVCCSARMHPINWEGFK